MDDNDITSDFMQEMDEDKEKVIKIISKGKLVPVFDHAIDEETYQGIAEILEGPVNVNFTGDAEIGYCKVRFYDSKEIAGHWINLKYLKERQHENQGSFI